MKDQTGKKLSEKKPKKLTKAQQTQKLILDVAASQFCSMGYHATPLREIAAAANMKAGSLYYHFDSKESLMLEVLNIGIEMISDSVKSELAKLPEDCEFSSILEAAMLGHLKAILEFGDYASTNIRNYGQIPEKVRLDAMPVRDSYENLWREILQKGINSGEISSEIDFGLLRLTLLGAMNWASEWYSNSGLSIEEIAARQARFFLHGISA